MKKSVSTFSVREWLFVDLFCTTFSPEACDIVVGRREPSSYLSQWIEVLDAISCCNCSHFYCLLTDLFVNILSLLYLDLHFVVSRGSSIVDCFKLGFSILLHYSNLLF